MTKHIKGYVVWRGNGEDRKPLFIPNENGKFRLVYSDNGSLIISDWDLLHKKDSMDLEVELTPPSWGIPSSTSKMNEVKVKALGMIVSTSAKFNRSTITSIDMCVDKIDFMIQYNPCHINPKKHKKDYHEFWDAVKKELLAIRKIYQ